MQHQVDDLTKRLQEELPAASAHRAELQQQCSKLQDELSTALAAHAEVEKVNQGQLQLLQQEPWAALTARAEMQQQVDDMSTQLEEDLSAALTNQAELQQRCSDLQMAQSNHEQLQEELSAVIAARAEVQQQVDDLTKQLNAKHETFACADTVAGSLSQSLEVSMRVSSVLEAQGSALELKCSSSGAEAEMQQQVNDFTEQHDSEHRASASADAAAGSLSKSPVNSSSGISVVETEGPVVELEAADITKVCFWSLCCTD
jgi:chromosome segregation ATPase